VLWQLSSDLYSRGVATTTAIEARTPGLPSLRQLVDGRGFQIAMVLIILSNTVVMATDFHGDAASQDYSRSLQALNIAFTGLFAIEMLVRILAYGPVGYLRDPMNDFDAIVVILSLVEAGFEIDYLTSESSNGDVNLNLGVTRDAPSPSLQIR